MLDFGLSETQSAFQRSVRDLLKRELPESRIREAAKRPEGYDSELFRKMADLGWPALSLPDQYGGAGGDWLDLAVLHEELGRALCISPLVPSLIGGQALLQWAGEELRGEWLRKIASGERVLTYAIEELGPGKLRAQVSGTACTVRGAYAAVPLGHAADAYIVAAKAGRDYAVCLVERAQPGVKATRMHTIGGMPLAACRFKDAQGVVLATGEGARDEMDALLLRSRLMLAAEMTGGARAALEIAVEYAKQRVAFGRPIGTFQALQHKMANMSIRIEGAQAALYYAATLLSQKKPARAACAAAQLQALDAYRYAATEGVQVFGGIGVMDESLISIHFRHAKTAELLLGPVATLHNHIADELSHPESRAMATTLLR